MTKDEIIRMAREAGLYVGTNLSGVVLVGHAKHNGLLIHMDVDDIERFAALVAKHTLANIDPSSFMSWQEGYAAGAAAEREACAKVCDIEAMKYREVDAWECAAAIRARGNK
jgi:hypothetical protein